MTDRFLVVLPTYNRAHTLGRALDSLLAQTDPDWVCAVLDDGSTDHTHDVLAEYLKRDRRINEFIFQGNRGGVAMNEAGMTMACYGDFAYWTRLGSDDAFLSHKLALDRLALAHAGACYGPYQHYSVFRGPWAASPEWTQELNIPQDARTMLLRGEFAVSWANIALRVEVLHAVQVAFGCFVDPRLRNMEDYLFNTRAARFTEFVWRAREEGGDHQVILGATSREQVPFPYQPDALYTIATESASYGAGMLSWRNHDAQMTDVCRGDDALRGIAPADLMTPNPLIIAGATA